VHALFVEIVKGPGYERARVLAAFAGSDES
jgi:hypothetical protein